MLHLDPGWTLAIGSGIGLAIVRQLDNHILSPNIVARTVKLHPVTVMLALLAGGTLLGLWGMLLAVPTVASAKILLLHAWDTRVTWPPPKVGGEPREAAPAHAGPVSRPTGAPSSSNGQHGLRGMLGAVRRGWRRLRRSGAGQPTRPV
jgi:hypothetical protein